MMGRVRRTQGSRSARQKLAFDALETRGLLSAVVSAAPARFDVSEADVVTAVFAPYDTDRQDVSVVPESIVVSATSNFSRTTGTSPVKISVSTSGGKTARTSGSGSKRSSSGSSSSKELLDEEQLTLRIPSEFASSSLLDDVPIASSAGAAGLSGDATPDGLGMSLLLGWSTSASIASGAPIGATVRGTMTDDHTGATPAEPTSPGLTVGAATVSEHGAHDEANAGGELVRGRPSDQAAVADNQEQATTWGHVLTGAIRPDWESVDSELRQFLFRLRHLANDPDDRDGTTSRAFWVGVSMAGTVILAHQVLRGPRQFLRESLRRRGWAVADLPLSVGPWPLDS